MMFLLYAVYILGHSFRKPKLQKFMECKTNDAQYLKAAQKADRRRSCVKLQPLNKDPGIKYCTQGPEYGFCVK